MSTTVRAVVFDVFGTLAHIENKRWPFARLIRLGYEADRIPVPNDAQRIMSTGVELAGAASMLGITLAANDMQSLAADLAAELASLVLYPDTLGVLQSLRKRGLKVALCSNLAAPYGPAIEHLLAKHVDSIVFSYQVGAVKPEPAIYAAACRSLLLMPEEILMVGDSLENDVIGPLAFGMQARHLARDTHQALPDRLQSLNEVLSVVAGQP